MAGGRLSLCIGAARDAIAHLSSRPMFPFQWLADEVRSLRLISQFSIKLDTVFQDLSNCESDRVRFGCGITTAQTVLDRTTTEFD